MIAAPDIEIQSAANRFAGAICESWTPRNATPLAEWVPQSVRMSSEWEAGAGAIDLIQRPYWKAVLQAFDDPEVRKITVQKSSQVGGTIILLAAMLGRASMTPAPGMVVTPDRESAVELRDRVYAMALESPSIRHLVPPERHWNTRAIDLKHCRIYLAWSGARQRLRGRPCRDVYQTEVDVYGSDKLGGNAVKAAEGRTKSFRQHKIYKETSVSPDPRIESTIAREYEASNKQKWICPCPHCGERQELRFFTYKHGELAGRGGVAGYVDKQGDDLDSDKARELAHYVCVKGCRIDDVELQRMVCAGDWVAAGQKIDRNGRISGKPKRSRRHCGYHIWSIHSPKITLGDLAAEYLDHKRDGKLHEFFGNWLGLPVTTKKKTRNWKQLGSRLAGEHLRGEVPPGVWFLTAGADVQDDEALWIVRGWGDRCASWLIDWGRVPRHAMNDDIEGMLDEVLGQASQWKVLGKNPIGKQSLRVRMLGTDANHRTMAVHDSIQGLEHDERKRVRAVRGDPKVDPIQRYRMNRLDASRAGDVYKGGLELWGIYVYHFYEDLSSKINQEAEAINWRLPKNIVSEGVEYLRQVANFRKKIEVDSSGRRRVKWAAISNMTPIDYWDCEVYARAVAEMIVDSQPGNPGWDASKWPGTTKANSTRSTARTQSGFSAR